MIQLLKNNSTKFFLLTLFFIQCLISNAQSLQKKEKIIADAADAKEAFIEKDGLIKNLFESAYAYVLFPNVGKGGIGVGGLLAMV